MCAPPQAPKVGPLWRYIVLPVVAYRPEAVAPEPEAVIVTPPSMVKDAPYSARKHGADPVVVTELPEAKLKIRFVPLIKPVGKPDMNIPEVPVAGANDPVHCTVIAWPFISRLVMM